MEYLTKQDYETAQKNGISRKNAYNRFYNLGWSREKTITHSIIKKNLWEQWKDKAVVKNITFYHRVQSGWDYEKAATTPLLSQAERYKHSPVKISEEQLKIADLNGINRYTVRQRVYNYKWPVEKAITLPAGTRLRKSSFNKYVTEKKAGAK